LEVSVKGTARKTVLIYSYEEVFVRKMSFLKELWDFLKVRKKFWLLPIIILLLLLGLLIIFTESSAVAPFIYTLF